MTYKQFFDEQKKGDFLALFSGLLLVLAFAPFNIYPLAFICPALLLGTWLYVSRWHAFWRGFLFGLGLFGGGVYWIYISIHTYGQAPVLLAGLLTSLLVAVLALFPAFTGYLVTRFAPGNTHAKMLRIFPAIWTLLEWIRSWIFTGFPWLLLGYTQTDLPSRGYATIFSVFGLSLFVAINCGGLVYLVFASRKARIKVITYLVLNWIVGALCCQISWTQPMGKPMPVALVQGNIEQTLKWSPEQLQNSLDTYAALSKPYLATPLEVWPEAAIPMPLDQAEPFLNKTKHDLEPENGALITGVLIKNIFDKGYYNAVIGIGNAHGIYLKRHLVPFGEYFPFSNLTKLILAQLHIPMSDMVSGSYNQSDIRIDDVNFAIYVCYEIAFPELVRAMPSNTNAIISVSDDAWFGHSIAQAQHLQMAQMRSIEHGVYSLFSTNNGITAIIDHKGNIIAQAQPYTTTVLTGQIQPMAGQTFWYTAGMDSLFLLLMLMLTYGFWRRFREPNLTR